MERGPPRKPAGSLSPKPLTVMRWQVHGSKRDTGVYVTAASPRLGSGPIMALVTRSWATLFQAHPSEHAPQVPDLRLS